MHKASTLAEFQDGEIRLVYGREQSGALWLLPDGTAKENRERAKTTLACPIYDCGTPQLTTVSRFPRRRDGFRHLHPGAGGHAPESLFHVQGKQRIADWLQERYPNSTISIEQQSDTSRTRVADVMITAPSGVRVAFEIQYSPLTPDAWRERHESYKEQGIVDVWLFGHTGRQLRVRSRFGDQFIVLNPTQRLMYELGVPVLWFNPITAELGAALSFGHSRVFAWEEGEFQAFPLDDASVHADGLWTPRLRKLAADTDIWRSRAAERAEEAARRQREQEEREGERRSKEFVDTTQKRQARAAAWPTSSERVFQLGMVGDVVPDYVGIDVGARLEVPDEEWQLHLYRLFVYGKRDDNEVILSNVTYSLLNRWWNLADRRILTRIVTAWFDRVVAAGNLMRKERVGRGAVRFGNVDGFVGTRVPEYVRPSPMTKSSSGNKPEWAKRPFIPNTLDADRPPFEWSRTEVVMTHDEQVAGQYAYCRKCGKTVQRSDGTTTGYHRRCEPPAFPTPSPSRASEWRPTMKPRTGNGPWCPACGEQVDELLPNGYHLLCDPSRRR